MRKNYTGLSASVDLEVQFHDVDAMEVVWHGHYLKYLEVARGALLRRFDYDYPQMRDSGYLWPIVECQLKYVRPARYGQKLKVTATLLEYENRLKIAYLIGEASSGERLLIAYSIQAAVAAKSGELQLVSPDILFEKLEKCCEA